MKCLGCFEDTIYPDQPTLFSRTSARGLLINQEGQIGMNHVFCDDEFGHRDHLESCGGGIEENESPLEALKREAREELGVEILSAHLLGYIDDEYHLLQRKNRSIFYIAFCSEVLYERKLSKLEKKLLRDPVWLEKEELMKRLNPQYNNGIGFLVTRRDWCALQYFLEAAETEKYRKYWKQTVKR